MLMWAGIQGGEDDLVHSASEKGRQYEDSCDGENKETQEQGQGGYRATSDTQPSCQLWSEKA